MSTVVRARPTPGRAIGSDTFVDLTDAKAAVSWADGGLLEVTFDADLAADVRRAIRLRIITESPAEEALMLTLADLIAQNPTTTADRLLRLERAVLALVRLIIRDES